MMRLIRVNPNNAIYYSKDFVKGFECGAKRQLEADKKSRPKGHWIWYEVRGQMLPYCSECGNGLDVIYEYDFCPDCGADMRGNNND